MGDVIKIPCTCEHAYQDEKYGKGIRVHNVCMQTDTTKKVQTGKVMAARCTACGIRKTL